MMLLRHSPENSFVKDYNAQCSRLCIDILGMFSSIIFILAVLAQNMLAHSFRLHSFNQRWVSQTRGLQMKNPSVFFGNEC